MKRPYILPDTKENDYKGVPSDINKQVTRGDQTKFKQMKYYLLAAISTGVIFFACHSSRQIENRNTGHDQIPFTIDGDCACTKSNGIDSETGTVKCGKLMFEYDFGRYSFPGPYTPEEDFLQGFKGNYYAKFFEKIYIDPKVQRMFIDSVQLISIIKKTSEEGLLFPCVPCNTIATIKFRRQTFRYPYTSDTSVWSKKDYRIFSDTIQGYYRKIYLSNKDSLPSGLYLAPIGKSSKNNKISIITKSDAENAYPILRSVRIKS